MFELGDSIKELGGTNTFTVAKLDSMTDNARHFDEARSGGVEAGLVHQVCNPLRGNGLQTSERKLISCK
jgi:hypothetical protein